MAALPILISDCDLLISKEKTTIRMYVLFGGGLVIAGIALLIVGTLLGSNEVTKSIISLGGVFITSLTTFPLKEIISAQRRISSCGILKNKIEAIRKDELNIDNDQRESLNSYLSDLFKKLME